MNVRKGVNIVNQNQLIKIDLCQKEGKPRGLLVSGLTCKELINCHSCPHNKKKVDSLKINTSFKSIGD